MRTPSANGVAGGTLALLAAVILAGTVWLCPECARELRQASPCGGSRCVSHAPMRGLAGGHSVVRDLATESSRASTEAWLGLLRFPAAHAPALWRSDSEIAAMFSREYLQRIETPLRC